MRQDYLQIIKSHYEQSWKGIPEILKLNKGPIWELPEEFCVLRFPPTETRKMWTYATCGMSVKSNTDQLELHLFSPSKNDGLVELLTATSHYHITGAQLGLGHTVNFGRPWLEGSLCDRGLISLPYLDGPSLEWLECDGKKIRFLWLIPVTEAEVRYKKEFGLEALEQKLESSNFNYLDPNRASAV